LQVAAEGDRLHLARVHEVPDGNRAVVLDLGLDIGDRAYVHWLYLRDVHRRHRPTRSRRWGSDVKPVLPAVRCSAPRRSRSIAGESSKSSIAPHSTHTRWWW